MAHESGSLYHMLSHFIYNNINMTNIQSRPIKGKNWEYRFFVDFEGRLEDTGVINALRGIKEEATSMKILGTY
jgi:chorismate mutase/prephenate dehydratase